MESFDLYREAKSQYEKLIPERNDEWIKDYIEKEDDDNLPF